MSDVINGVLPTSTGSEVNRLSRLDGNPINNGDMNELLSSLGIEYIQRVIESNIREGCTLGVTSTFRVTPFRAHETGDWEMPAKEELELPDQYANWTHKLVRISREAYKDIKLLGNISPITDTSASEDDKCFAKVANGSAAGRIEFARRLHYPQIKALADEGIDSILVEACRHPDDALAIAQSVRENNNINSLIVSFEADEFGLPDPIYKRIGYSFYDMKSDLQKEVGENVNVKIGINCIGASRVTELLEAGQRFDIVYPNQSDQNRCPPCILKMIRTILNEVHSDNLRDTLHETLNQASETSANELESVWKQCIESGTDIIGICCGGRPEHVAIASKIFSKTNAVYV